MAANTNSSDKTLYIAIGVILFIGFAVVVWAVRSTKKEAPSWQQRDAEVQELDAKLKGLTQTIKSMAGSSKCTGDSDCRVIGLGVKTCGGYNDFLIYSTVDVKEDELLETVRDFNATFERFVNLSLKVPPCGHAPKPVHCENKVCDVRQ